jgi:type VI secretion system protein
VAIEFAFLETIAGRSALNPDAGPPGNLAEAVRENLILLLNTRRGAVGHLPTYGMPDLADYYKSFPDSLDDLGVAIQDTVTRFEPRLSQVEVELAATALSVFQATFTIKGVINDSRGRPVEVRFQTVVSGAGETRVSM